jgi:hypothetical protein
MDTSKKLVTPFRIANLVMLPLLLMSVVVQYNDPDGIVWMLIYGYSLVITVPAIFGVYTAWAIPGTLGYLGGFAALVPTFEHPYLKSELTREGGGLLIAGVWMLCLAIAWYRSPARIPVAEPMPMGTLQLVRPTAGGGGGGGGCGSGSCGCGKK